jgi:uncharacterized protein YndB with AHSA1/START domain
MSRPSFAYVTYIATTPERLWEALTSAEFTERYMFGRRVESTWQVGAPVRYWKAGGGRVLSDSGEVLQADRPRRLSYTWRVEFDEALQREGHSRVTFELEPIGSEVKLTVVHDEMPEGSALFKGISNGWPKSLASLKTLLETGRALAISSAEAGMPGEAEVVAMARGGA